MPAPVEGSAWKLVVIYVAWLLASVGIAVIGALLVGVVVTMFGVDAQSVAHRRMVEIVAVVGFVVLAAAPFVLRRRIDRSEHDHAG